jgi:hypothetical protein
MPIVTPDPEYRYYNCNLQCPKFKTEEFQASSLGLSQWSPSGILSENAFLDYDTEFDIAPAALSQPSSIGELTVYLRNNIGTAQCGILMNIVSKANGTITQVLTYQTVTTFSSITAVKLNETTIRVTSSTPATCYWIWRGI